MSRRFGERGTLAGVVTIAIVVVVSTSCRPGAAGGRRIHARVLVADDGAREIIGWWDAERSEECSFRRADDGKMRCLPFPTLVAGNADSTCTNRVAHLVHPDIEGCDPPLPAYGSSFRSEGDCRGGERVFPVIGPPEEFRDWCAGEPGDCTCFKGADPLQGVRVGAALPPESFVESVLAVEGTGRVVSRVRKTEDGTTEWLGWYDTKLGSSCDFVPIDAMTAACIPQELVVSGFETTPGTHPHIGSTCTGLRDPDTIIADTCSDEGSPPVGQCTEPHMPPDVYSFVVEGDCGTVPRVQRVGAKAPGAHSDSWYNKGTSQSECFEAHACSLENISVDDLETRPLDGTPDGGPTTSGTRLRAYPAGLRPCSNTDGPPPDRSRWRDLKLGMDCELTTATDGSTRCLPFENYGMRADDGVRFVDPDCKIAFARSVDSPPAGPMVVSVPDEGALRAPDAPRCTPTRSAFRAEPRTQVSTFVADGGACKPSGDPPLDGWALTRLAPTELVGAKVVID